MAQATYKQLRAIFWATGTVTTGWDIDAGTASDILKDLYNGLEYTMPDGTVLKPKRMTDEQMSAIWDKAHEAGMAALKECKPNAMIVEQHEDQLDDTSPVTKRYVVPEGPCGFAWVSLKGNTAFGKWALKTKRASKAYRGGLQTWVHEGGQSYEKKLAYAYAFAGVLNENGIPAHAEGRLD